MNDTRLVEFQPLRSAIAKLQSENERLVFDYETAQGEKDARSHCYKLRQTKGKIGEVHKVAKAEALAHCQLVDSEKNDCLAAVEGMIDVHMKPINAKLQRRKDAEEAAAQKLADEAAEEEEKRLASIAAQEEENEIEADRLAKVKSDQEAAEKKRVAAIAEEDRLRQLNIDADEDARLQAVRAEQADRAAKVKVEEDARQKKILADNAQLAADRLAFDKERQAEADARKREQNARDLAVANAEAARQAAVEYDQDWDWALMDNQTHDAEIERLRVENEEHRAAVHKLLDEALTAALGELFTAGQLINFIDEVQPDEIQINY